MRAVVTITDAADQYISGILESNVGMVLVAGYDNKGCSGHKYTFNLIKESDVNAGDEVIELQHGSLVIPTKYLLGLIGSTLDFTGNQFEKKLEWNNPLATNHCGCGESFQLSNQSGCNK